MRPTACYRRFAVRLRRICSGDGVGEAVEPAQPYNPCVSPKRTIPTSTLRVMTSPCRASGGALYTTREDRRSQLTS